MEWQEKHSEATRLLEQARELKDNISNAEDAERFLKMTEDARRLGSEAREAKTADDKARGEAILAEASAQASAPVSTIPTVKAMAQVDPGGDDMLAARKMLSRFGMTEKAARELSVKAVNEGSGGTGGFLVPPQYMQNLFAETRRQGNALRRTGLLNEIPTNSFQVLIPRGSGAATAGVVAEGQTKPIADQAFTQVTINIFVLAGLIRLTKQMAMDADPAAGQIAVDELGTLLGNLEEQKIYNGSGTGEPRGILNTTGTSAIPAATQTALNGAGSGQTLIDAIYDATVAIQTAYFAPPTAVVMHPKRLAYLMKSKDSQNNYLFNPAGSFRAPGALGGLPGGTSWDNSTPAGGQLTQSIPTIMGIPIIVSANVPTNLGGGTNQDTVMLGDWKMAYWFQRQEATLDVSDVASDTFTTNTVLYRLEERVGFSIERYPSAFCAFTGTSLV